MKRIDTRSVRIAPAGPFRHIRGRSAPRNRKPVFPSAAGRMFTIDPIARSLGMQFPLPIGAGAATTTVGTKQAEHPPP